jgi:DNA mismatch repair protein MutL
VVVRLPEDLAPEAWNFEAELSSLGFKFEPFGEGAVRLIKVPETVSDAETALLAALGALAGGEDLAKALACKGSTRFGESLSREEKRLCREEMEGLLTEWSATDFRDICPHGRPIVKRVRLADLLREFGRI